MKQIAVGIPPAAFCYGQSGIRESEFVSAMTTRKMTVVLFGGKMKEKLTKDKNEAEKRFGRHLAANVILLLALVFVILFLSGRENYARQLQQMNEYMNTLSSRTVKHVGDVFQDKSMAVNSADYLYGHLLQEEKANIEYLTALEQESGFDFIRFVDKNGKSYTSDGKTADVSDRIYYTDGIKGQSGYGVAV